MRRLFNYEKKHEPVASSRVFLSRLTRNAVWALGVVVVSLAIGCAGYMGFEGMSLIDAFNNAAMILSGMGPVSPLNTAGGKIFAALYAIASGLLLFAIAGLLMAPVYHRLLHRFHVEDEEKTPQPRPQPPRPPRRRPKR